MSCDCASELRALREFVLIAIRDLAAVRQRLEEIAPGGGEAPGPTPEEAAKAQAEAEEREKQRQEAFLRMRAENGQTEQTDETDAAVLSELWMLQ